MAQPSTCETRKYFWGETFYTDSRLSTTSDVSMPGMVEDLSEEVEMSSHDNYHLSSSRLFDSYFDEASRAASPLSKLNRAFARENHQYPDFPPSRSGPIQSTRRSDAKPVTPGSSTKPYGTWPLRNESNQKSAGNDFSTHPRRPTNHVHIYTTAQVPNLEPLSPEFQPAFSSGNARSSCPPRIPEETKILEEPKEAEEANQVHEVSHFEYSDDDEESKAETGGTRLMKRLHIRSVSAGKIGEIKAPSLRRFFRSSRKS